MRIHILGELIFIQTKIFIVTSVIKKMNIFSLVANFTRSLDKTRPITAAIAIPYANDRAVSIG